MTDLPAPSLRLRDLPDVEQYVRAVVDCIAPAARSRDTLQAHGVLAVIRVERALPPGIPLMPVLDQVLPARLAALDLTRARGHDPLAEVA